MVSWSLSALLIAAVIACGCTAQTGRIIENTTQDNFSEPLPEPLEIAAEENDTAVADSHAFAENSTGPANASAHPAAGPSSGSSESPVPDQQAGPSESPVPQSPEPSCNDSETICWDGNISRCTNIYTGGSCTNCTPYCPGPPACTIQCGTCQAVDNATCTCTTLTVCCGNGLCEAGEDWQNCSSECSQPPEPGTAVLSEIMYNPEQSENYNEWIEIFNPSTNSVDLSNWSLCGKALLAGYVSHSDNNTHLEAGTVLAAGTFAVITDGGSGTEVYGNFNVSQSALALHVDASSLCGGLKNTDNETVTLTDGSGNVVDELLYFGELAAGGKTISLSGNWSESEPTPGW